MSANRKVIEAEWLDYVKNVLPPTLSPSSIQYLETKKAFYAGAGTLFSALIKALSLENEPTTADMVTMDGIYSELSAYVDSVCVVEPSTGIAQVGILLAAGGAEPSTKKAVEAASLLPRGAEPLNQHGGGALGANGGVGQKGVDGGPRAPDALRRTMPPAGPSAVDLIRLGGDGHVPGLVFRVQVFADEPAVILDHPLGHEPTDGPYLDDNNFKGLPEKMEPGIYEIVADFDFYQGYFEGHPADGESDWEYTVKKVTRIGTPAEGETE